MAIPNTEALCAALEQERDTHFWGQDYKICPRLAYEVLGDGKQLVAICPANTRPMFYYIRVDSLWAMDCDDHEGICTADNCFVENADAMMEAIEDEFGEWPDANEDDRGECSLFDCGFSWWPVDWPGTQSHIWQD